MNLKDALEKSLLATKEYIDAELVEKANTEHGTHLTLGTGSSNAAAGNHTHNYAGSSSVGGTANSVNGLTFWTGTQAQYNELSSKSNSTIYIIIG